MRGKTTLQNFIDQVQQVSENHYDETVRLTEMNFESLDHMSISGQNINILLSAQRLLANRLRVPHSYLARCPGELQKINLNYWLKEQEKQRESLLCRFDGTSLRAVFTERYTAVDNADILYRMLKNGFKPSAEIHYSMDENMMILKIPDYVRAFGISGDRMVPGIGIANSEVGALSFRVEAYFYRLVCSNGLIAKVSTTSSFKHISKKALDELPDILSRMLGESLIGQRKLEISMSMAVDNPQQTMDSFNKQFQLNQAEVDAVARGWSLESENSTMFGIIQAYTRGAQDQSLTVEESYNLERVGGQILSLVRQ